MSDQAMIPPSVSDAVRQHWGWFLALGIVFIIGGTFAILAPFVASVVVTLVVAVVLVILGILQIIHAWRVQSWGGFLWQLIIGLVILIGGIAIYLNPVAGTLALTLVVAALFLAKGIFQIILGFQLRPHDGWGWIVAAGVIAAIVGIMIWFNFPFSGVYALGILAGISLIFTGWAYVAISLAARRTGASKAA